MEIKDFKLGLRIAYIGDNEDNNKVIIGKIVEISLIDNPIEDSYISLRDENSFEIIRIYYNAFNKCILNFNNIINKINNKKYNTQVIILERLSTETIDKYDNKVANFINTHDIISLHYATSQYKDGTIHYSVMILYKE